MRWITGSSAGRWYYGLALTLVGLCACQLKQLVAPPPPARLIVSPEKLEDSAVVGSDVALTHDLQVQTEGETRVNWRVNTATGSPWLTVEQSDTTGSGTVRLTLNPEPLAPGFYQDTIVVSPDGWSGESVRIPVTLAVRESTIRLFFTSQPRNTRRNTTMFPVQVTARDEEGRTVSDYTGPVTITIADNPADGTLSGTTTVSATGGIARFTQLKIDRPGDGYTLRATSGIISTVSNRFNITDKGPSRSESTVSAAMSEIAASTGASAVTITVTARDEDGFAIPDVPVTVSASGADNDLAPASGVTDESGVFTTRLTSTRAEIKIIAATVAGLALDRTAQVTVRSAAATLLVFQVQPTSTPVNEVIRPAVVLQARDQFGNRAQDFSADIEVSIANDASLFGSARLRGHRRVRAQDGESRFDDLELSNFGGGFTLRATAPGVSPATSEPFDVTFL